MIKTDKKNYLLFSVQKIKNQSKNPVFKSLELFGYMKQCTWSMSFSDFWIVIFSSKQCSRKTVALSKETVRVWIKGWSPWVNDGWKVLTACNYTSHCFKQPSEHVAMFICYLLVYWITIHVTLSFDEELFSSYFHFDKVGCRSFHFTLIFFTYAWGYQNEQKPCR